MKICVWHIVPCAGSLIVSTAACTWIHSGFCSFCTKTQPEFWHPKKRGFPSTLFAMHLHTIRWHCHARTGPFPFFEGSLTWPLLFFPPFLRGEMTRSRSPIRKWHREWASHRGETSQQRSSRWFYFPLMKMFQQLRLLTISKYFSLWASKKMVLAISSGAAFIKTRGRQKRKQLVKISFHPPIWQTCGDAAERLLCRCPRHDAQLHRRRFTAAESRLLRRNLEVPWRWRCPEMNSRLRRRALASVLTTGTHTHTQTRTNTSDVITLGCAIK